MTHGRSEKEKRKAGADAAEGTERALEKERRALKLSHRKALKRVSEAMDANKKDSADHPVRLKAADLYFEVFDLKPKKEVRLTGNKGGPIEVNSTSDIGPTLREILRGLRQTILGRPGPPTNGDNVPGVGKG